MEATRYPDSACEAHLNVETSEPVCIICMSRQIDSLIARVRELELEEENKRLDFERRAARG